MMMGPWWLANFATTWFIVAPLLAGAWRLFRSFFKRPARALLALVDTDLTIDFARREWEDYSIQASNAYNEVKAYLSSSCSRDARAFQAEIAAQGDKIMLSLRLGQEVSDEFGGAVLWWSSVADREDGQRFTRRCYRLTFHRRHLELVKGRYLPYVLEKGREALLASRQRRLYSNNVITDNSYWERVWDHIYLKHPVTFDTLAMDPAKKKEIMDDLDAFRNGKEEYARAGKPWKRGYLLYGPPGTGKSSMIAAMANYLSYDIYDVELTVVRHNHDLRKLLVEIADKSIIIIEDIDCSLDLTGERRRLRKMRKSSSSASGGGGSDDEDKPSKVTLSGLLNFVDGLWSACGSERIVVFTTNHVDKLDPALIRRGRMDKHIEMSYCCFEAFRTLAKNHLGVDAHPLFGAVEELLREVKVTPADVAECLLTSTREGHGVDSTLEHLIEVVKKAKIKPEAAGEKKARRRRRRRKKRQHEEKVDAEEATAAAAAPAELPESAEEQEKNMMALE